MNSKLLFYRLGGIPGRNRFGLVQFGVASDLNLWEPLIGDRLKFLEVEIAKEGEAKVWDAALDGDEEYQLAEIISGPVEGYVEREMIGEPVWIEILD